MLTISGRIGDSPLIGCGAYADDETGCSSTAGIRGEENARLGGLTRMTCENMKNGKTAQEAVDLATKHAEKRLKLTLKRGTLLAIDKEGNIGVNTLQNSDKICVCVMKEGETRPIYPLDNYS